MKIKRFFSKKSYLFKTGFLSLLALPTLFLLSYLLFIVYYNGKFYPRIKIAGQSLNGKTPILANQILLSDFQNRIAQPIPLTFKDQIYNLNLAEASPTLNFTEQIDQSYNLGRSGDYIDDFRTQAYLLIFGQSFTPKLTYKNQSFLTDQINQIALSLKKDPINAQLNLMGNTTPSEEGQELDKDLLLKQLENYLTLLSPKPIYLPVKITQPQFTTSDAQKAQDVLDTIKDRPIKLSYEKQNWIIDQPTLFKLLNLTGKETALEMPQAEIGENILPETFYLLDKNKVSQYLKEISETIEQPAQNARFTFDPSTKKVKEFQPSKEGKTVDINQTIILMTKALTSLDTRDITLPVKVDKPTITTESVNSLGINELIGEGVSHFTGSIENRIYNIGLAASRINGILVAPGETFSFLKTVGDISASTGYKQAYVIKSGRTVLDDGGGVCQVSTTVFRAALNAGLPVTERTAHAYRVGYYEQGFPPGLDATVFYPSVDLKFKNDTPSTILVQATVSGTSLYVDIYGTNDGRVSTLTTPKILSQTPPLPEIRQDDPSLPRGTVKQVDWPAWGANVVFDRTVKKGEETLIQETWRSNFRPWQAVYLVGTKD